MTTREMASMDMATRVSIRVKPLSEPPGHHTCIARYDVPLTHDLRELHCPGYKVNSYFVLPASLIGHSYLTPAASATGEKKDPKETRIKFTLPRYPFCKFNPLG